MPDDEPLDDARAVGMAAAAATAKVIETAARAAADQRDRRPQRVPEPKQTGREASVDTDSNKREPRLEQATAWAQENDPKAFDLYARDRMGADTADGRRSAESALIRTWERTTPHPYDSARRRTEADHALKAAGVADEPRKARTVSDLLNGADPATAATAGTSAKAATKTPKRRTSEQTRTR